MTKRKANTLAVLYPDANGSAAYPEAADTEPDLDPRAPPRAPVTPDELAHALVQLEPEAFAPAPAAAVAPDPAPPPAPPPPAGQQRQRRIGPEVTKAETKLIQLERSRDESLRNHALSWDAKRTSFIAGLPEDVRAALVAMRVLEPADPGED